ncbi:hypothetical protein L6452_32018 [Arctium lappa]|uniref:Uncharacterized protein n=1 Tax=Arctium lappa TaxID=4217 RepID=A0ACB8Z349_ARCLA|nr:hypothetical protein L6452_32018 [Arctium lappa]
MYYLKSSSSSSQIHVAVVPYAQLTILFFFFSGASGATFTVVNDCGFTVWPGIITLNANDFNFTGFKLTKGTSRSFQVPVGWRGRIWGRTGCTFDESGRGSCTTGACGTHEMECNRGEDPTATIAEFALNQFNDMDFYDVSLVNGYNIQMLVKPDSTLYGCPETGCIQDLNQRCPTELTLKGRTGCMGPCQAFGSPEDCCDNSTCGPTQYSRLFKSACPRSYSYPKDDATSTFTCMGGNYTIRFCPPTHAFSTIKLGQQIGPTDQLVSTSGKFTLGFFKSDYSYLGIWHTNDFQSRKVWVGNPNAPVISTSGAHALSMDPKTGNLIIVDRGKTLTNITDLQAGPNPDLIATLEDNGNLLLIKTIDKSILWQSFDHPTNILLPGMKLGSNMKAGHTWTLTSWLSDEISDSGAFTLSWEPMEEASQRLMIRRRCNPTGQVGIYIIKHFSICNGCIESSLTQCRREVDSFSERNGDFAPDMTRNVVDDDSSLSISDCFVKCWNDCTCVGFASSATNGTGCAIWSGSNSFIVSPRNTSTLKYVISQNAISSSTEYERRERDEYFLGLTASESFKDVHQLEGNGGNGNNLLLFSLTSIMAATDDFSIENKLGQGGFGPVYKAWELWRQGDALALMDPTLGSTCVVQQFLRTVHVALLCVQESATDRPTTSDMISMLLNDTMLLPTPNKPAFVIRREETRSTSDESRPKDCSVNNMATTVIEGR